MPRRSERDAVITGPEGGRRSVTHSGVRLSILHHPDPNRVGACSWIEELESGVPALFGRSAPEFRTGGQGPLLPLGDPFVSRKVAWLRWVAGSLEVAPIAGATPLYVGGRRLREPVRVARDRLMDRGITLDVSGRILLNIDLIRDHERDDLGFVGVSSAAGDVRSAIRSYADLAMPVLVVGEAGTGKSLVGRSLHGAGRRSKGPWVEIGHYGAYDDPKGLEDAVEAAAGGTLLIDRIGALSGPTQDRLLAFLDRPRAGDADTDPRLVSTSDEDPEALVRAGTHSRSLLDRLAVGLVHIPPLRERRVDLALLFHRFMARELAEVAADDRLADPGVVERPWLTLDLVFEVMEHGFPGNARELRNLCTQIAVHSSGLDRAEIPPAASARLRSFDSWRETGEPSEGKALSKVGGPKLAAPRVRAVLAAQRWNLAAAARELGVARNTLVAFMERTPGFRRVKDIPDAELIEAVDRFGDDAEALAVELEVSLHGLRIRLSELEPPG